MIDALTQSDEMADAEVGFVHGFEERLLALFDRHEELSQLGYEEAKRLGAEAAGTAVAPVLWRAVVGETWDTTRTTEFLDISRQALHQRVKNWTILALPGRGTRHLPAWKFDRARQAVRPVLT